ncbi:thiamine phosphate synthase [Candidatus Pelagibacter sp.]|nr:thiamine phosphate synthase [Candidatus Pelagibacter sp.]
MFKSIYYYIDKFNRDEIYKLNKTINIIYRNYSNRFNKKEILQLVTFCKKQRRKVYISNNLKLALRFNFDGVYIPAFNKTLNYKNIPKKNFEIIGSAHNVKEIINKEYQGCTKIFLSPIFKTKKNRSYLGVTKFNIIKLTAKKNIISLGGINSENIRYLRMCRVEGFASISWIKKNGPSINTGPF